MKTFLRRYSPALLSGFLLALCFPSWGVFPLAWVALVPLFVSSAEKTPKQAAKRFFLAGWLFHSMVLNWLIANAYWAGGWAFVGYQLLCVFMGLYWALAGFLWRWLYSRHRWLGGATALALLWTTMEIAQDHLFSGFGWSALGYSQGPNQAFRQLAALGGVPLLTFVLVFANAFFALGYCQEPGRGYSLRVRMVRMACGGGIILFVHGLGMLLLREADTANGLRVGVIQTDFALEMKMDAEYTQEMVRNAADKSRALAVNTPVDLIVWPESAIMTQVEDPGIRFQLEALAKDIKTPLFTGAERTEPHTGQSLNSSYLFDAEGKPGDYYDKVHLAPFGEYFPFSNYVPVLKEMVPAIGDLAQGTEQKVFPIKDRTFGPLICFEVLFGDLAERLREKGADFLVVITNLGWFGESSAINQEFELARMRAVETRLPVVHCANTGISGMFDPYGRFSMVNLCFPDGVHADTIRPGLNPENLIKNRLAGAFTVPKPGVRPLPVSPRHFQYVFVLGSALLLIAACGFPRRNDSVKDKA